MRLGYVIAYVPDVVAALDFYQTAFGCERRFLDAEGRYGEVETGAVPLGFASMAQASANGVSPAPIPPGTTAAVEIAFVVADVAAAFAQAVAAGATAVAAPAVKPWGQTVAYLRDPFGILVELCTPMPG